MKWPYLTLSHFLLKNTDFFVDVKAIHDETLELSQKWLGRMSSETRDGIISHYGAIPEPEIDFWSLPNGPAWLWWILAILPLQPKDQVCAVLINFFKLKIYLLLKLLY